MKRLVSYFLRGILFVVPIGLSMWLLVGAFTTIDDLVRHQLRLPIPGLGFVVMLASITVIGFLASNFLTRRLLRGLEHVFDRLPVVKMLHGAVKDLLNAFVGDKRRFDKPVIVALNRDGHVKAMGFITRDQMDHYQQPDSVAVYFPQAYNFAGQVVLVPRDAVTPLDIPASEVMTFIVSGGVSGR